MMQGWKDEDMADGDIADGEMATYQEDNPTHPTRRTGKTVRTGKKVRYQLSVGDPFESGGIAPPPLLWVGGGGILPSLSPSIT
jgi:hypothetical protein